MSESTSQPNYKTPSYVRKASNNYYQRLRANPEKYKEYLEKRKDYNRKRALKKKELKQQEKIRLEELQKSTEIYPHYSENYNPSDDNSSCND